jgi:hypothetical protein
MTKYCAVLFVFLCAIASSELKDDVVHSEFLSLQTGMSHTNKSRVGVFAKHNIIPKTVLCELSGFLHKEGELSNPNNMFLVRTPYGQNFHLAENTVCSKFIACQESDFLDGSIINYEKAQFVECNGEMVGTSSGKFMVRSTRQINISSEIYVRYFNRFSPGVSADDSSTKNEIELVKKNYNDKALHSDELFLYKAPTLVPFLKYKATGVFAKYFIPQYGSVCVNRGRVYPLQHPRVSDRYSPPIRSNGSLWKLEMENICGFINDIVDINRVYSRDEVKHMYDGNESLHTIPTFQGFSYNVINVASEENTLVPIMVATVDIQAGAELYMAYGK